MFNSKSSHVNQGISSRAIPKNASQDSLTQQKRRHINSSTDASNRKPTLRKTKLKPIIKLSEDSEDDVITKFENEKKKVQSLFSSKPFGKIESNSDKYVLVNINAIIKFQALFRGYRVRKNLHQDSGNNKKAKIRFRSGSVDTSRSSSSLSSSNSENVTETIQYYSKRPMIDFLEFLEVQSVDDDTVDHNDEEEEGEEENEDSVTLAQQKLQIYLLERQLENLKSKKKRVTRSPDLVPNETKQTLLTTQLNLPKQTDSYMKERLLSSSPLSKRSISSVSSSRSRSRKNENESKIDGKLLEKLSSAYRVSQPKINNRSTKTNVNKSRVEPV